MLHYMHPQPLKSKFAGTVAVLLFYRQRKDRPQYVGGTYFFRERGGERERDWLLLWVVILTLLLLYGII